jgi:hypothetical protein
MSFAQSVDELMGSDPADRRQAERNAVYRDAWLRARDGTIYSVVVVDISSGGAGLAHLGPHALRPGDRVELAIDMESPGDEVWLPAVVRWRTAGRAGVAFRGLSPFAVARVLLGCSRRG